MANIDHPLLGDAKYGNFNLNKKFENEFKYSHQFLIAYKLHFDKLSGVLEYLSNKTFTCSMPEIEKRIINKLREN
jgi:23S rRNA pseudouridine955/2504/2580 synthase